MLQNRYIQNFFVLKQTEVISSLFIMQLFRNFIVLWCIR